MDTTDARVRLLSPNGRLRNGILYQLYRHLLPCFKGHSFRLHGMYLTNHKLFLILIEFFLKVAITCICLFIILPLTLVGTVLGRNLAGQPDYPCRVNAVPRPIPEKKWFMEPAVIVALGGILPFGSIFIEMYFAFILLTR